MGFKIIAFIGVIVSEIILRFAYLETGDADFDTIGKCIGVLGILLLVLGIIGWIAAPAPAKVGHGKISDGTDSVNIDFYAKKNDEEIAEDFSYGSKCIMWGAVFFFGALIGSIISWMLFGAA